MRGVDALMRSLKEQEVEVVFGLPGGANLPTYDALYDAGIRHVLVRHEAGGGHAAQGYAKATGKVGVSIATSGPGATNLVTPIMDAMMDSVPVVFLVGQVRQDLLGADGFQEADTLGMTRQIAKHSFSLQEAPVSMNRAIREAFYIAQTGRPGPVVLDIPVDLSRDLGLDNVDNVSLADSLPGYKPSRKQPTKGRHRQVLRAAHALALSRRPVIYVGGGAITGNASAAVTELCTADRFPVTCTLMGLGAFPGTHAQSLGMLGMHGTRTANYAMDGADLIVAIGARFDDRVTGKLSEFAPRAKIIHIDIDPAEIAKNVPTHIPIVGDAADLVPLLTAAYREEHADLDRLTDWWEQIAAWQRAFPLSYTDSQDSEIKPQYMIEALYEATSGDAIVTADVGQHQMWAAQYYQFDKPRRWINSGGLGTMGFGLPAALGAKVGRPGDTVICITGDGSIQMNIQELATCKQEGIDVKVFVMNNGYLGMVRQWQELFWDERYSQVDLGVWPDFVKLAEAYGWAGRRFADKTTLVDDFREALAIDGPVLVDVPVTRDENTYPIIPPGAAARDMEGPVTPISGGAFREAYSAREMVAPGEK